MYRGKPLICVWHMGFKAAVVDLENYQDQYRITGRPQQTLYEGVRLSDNKECYLKIFTPTNNQFRGHRFEGLLELYPMPRRERMEYEYSVRPETI